jgi:dihydrofolate reductase
VATSPDEALEHAAGEGVDEVMVIGGERVYEVFLPRSGRIHMTRVHATIEGDAFFPGLDPDEWRTVMSQAFRATRHQPLAFTFETIERHNALNRAL